MCSLVVHTGPYRSVTVDHIITTGLCIPKGNVSPSAAGIPLVELAALGPVAYGEGVVLGARLVVRPAVQLAGDVCGGGLVALPVVLFVHSVVVGRAYITDNR